MNDIDSNEIENIITKISGMDIETFLTMSKNVAKYTKENHSLEAFELKMKNIINEITFSL